MQRLSWAQNVNFRDRSSQQRVWRFPWRALRLPGRTIVRTLPAPPLHDGTRSRTGGPESDNLHSPRAATALCMLSVYTSFCLCIFVPVPGSPGMPVRPAPNGASLVLLAPISRF
jgi:hypothetical protein